MDIKQIVGHTNRLSGILLTAVRGARPGMLAMMFGSSQIILGICFIIYFCIVGYLDQDEVDDLKNLPAIIQFIITSPAYTGMFFIIIGSVFLIGGNILSAIDKTHRYAIKKNDEFNEILNSFKSIIESQCNKANNIHNLADEETDKPSFAKNCREISVQNKTDPAVSKKKSLRIWPFNS